MTWPVDQESAANLWEGSRPSFDRAELEDYNVATCKRQGKARVRIVLKRPTLLRARMSSAIKSEI